MAVRANCARDQLTKASKFIIIRLYLNVLGVYSTFDKFLLHIFGFGSAVATDLLLQKVREEEYFQDGEHDE